MVGMRSMRFTSSPDRGNNPANRSDNHIRHGAQHEDLERAMPIAVPAEDHAERTIAQAENDPAQKARRQEMPRQTQKPKNRNRCEEAEDHRRGNIPLQGKALQERGMIGDDQPGDENQRQTNTDVNTRADRRVRENVEPTITGQMRTNRHRVLGSQNACNRLTRIHSDGCVTSTTTGAHGALSFPARSTAVTVYQ